jgi:stage V sporulation protein B
MVSYVKRALSSVGILFFFAVVGAGSAYLLRLFFAHKLGVESYGLFYAVYALLAFVISFGDLGLGMALTKYTAEFSVQKKFKAIKNSIVFVLFENIVVSALFVLLFFFLADFLAVHYFKTSEASFLIKLIVVAFFFQAFLDVLRWSFLGFQDMVSYAVVHHLKTTSVLALALIFFHFFDGLYAASYAYIFYPLVFLLFFLPVFFKKTFPSFFTLRSRFDKVLIKKLFSFALPQTITTSGSLTLGYMDTIFLTLFRNVVEVGVYNVALPTAKLLTFVSEGIATFLIPFTSELWSKGHKQHLLDGAQLLYKYLFMVGLPGIGVLIAFSDVLITLFFGMDYFDAVLPLRILSFGSLGLMMYIVNFAFLSGLNQPKVNAKIMGSAALLNAALNIVLIPFYGVVGAAIATSTSYFFIFGTSMWYIRKFIPIRVPFLDWGKTLCSTFVMVLLIFYLKGVFMFNNIWEAGIIVGIVGIVYLLLLYSMKLLDFVELKGIFDQITKGK